MTVGTVVTWTSQAAGITKTKTGTIVAVVPPGAYPGIVCKQNNIEGALDAGAAWRKHESYVVRIAGTRRRLYWPIVSLLTEVAAAPSPAPEATA